MGVARTHQGLPDGRTKDHLLPLIESLGKRGMEISSTAHKVLCHYVWRSRTEDYQPGLKCGLWEKVCNVATDLDLSPRAVNGAERELEAAGLIQRTTGGNGARYGSRCKGVIITFCGISLAPLIERYSELETALQARQLHRQAMDICRAEIRHMRRLIREAGDATSCGQSDQIAHCGRVSRIADKEQLEAIRDALQAVLTSIAGTPKTSDASEENGSPCLQQEQSRICSSEGERPPAKVRPQHILALASDEYRATLAGLGGVSPANIIEASSRMAMSLGIRAGVWRNACAVLGRDRAALCVLIIDRNARRGGSDPYEARSPAACLHGMIQRASQGAFYLDRLLWASQRAVGVGVAPASIVVMPNAPAAAPKIAQFAEGLLGRLRTGLDGGQA